MTEKILPTVMRRGLFGVGFCYLVALTLPLVAVNQDLALGLCVLLLQANLALFLAVCALANSDAKRFFIWASRIRLLSLFLTGILVAFHPTSPQNWLAWAWMVAPIWWISHILAAAGLYLVYEEFRPGGPAWLPLVAPFAAGLVLLNPFGWAGHVVMLGCLTLSAFQALLFFWGAVAGPSR